MREAADMSCSTGLMSLLPASPHRPCTLQVLRNMSNMLRMLAAAKPPAMSAGLEALMRQQQPASRAAGAPQHSPTLPFALVFVTHAHCTMQSAESSQGHFITLNVGLGLVHQPRVHWGWEVQKHHASGPELPIGLRTMAHHIQCVLKQPLPLELTRYKHTLVCMDTRTLQRCCECKSTPGERGGGGCVG